MALRSLRRTRCTYGEITTAVPPIPSGQAEPSPLLHTLQLRSSRTRLLCSPTLRRQLHCRSRTSAGPTPKASNFQVRRGAPPGKPTTTQWLSQLAKTIRLPLPAGGTPPAVGSLDPARGCQTSL